MKLDNKGFALTSIIYMLIVLFLMILLLILANLAQRKVVLDKIKNDVKENLNQGGLLAQNIYTVTFDPTIGQINQTTKQVTYNEPYSELPTPTREGYKFIGWRGKNLIDENKITSNYYLNKDGQELTDNNNPWSHSDYIEIESGKTYTFNPNSTAGASAKHCVYDENKNLITTFDSGPATMEMPSNAKYIRLSFRSTSNNIQLEEGSTATTYEPYLITPSTIVTRQENHTLYAIWEPYYTVTFDPNGGTLSQNTKQVLYNEPYGELPTPTKEGYTFLGWNGKNMFDMTGWLNSFSTATHGTIVKGENSIQITATSDDAYTNSWQGNSVLKTSIMPNTKYTISWESDNNITALSYGFINGNWSDGYRVAGNNAIKKNFVFTAPQDGEYITYRVGASTSGDSITYSNIQIEEGETATEYEPYYITPSTTVVQKNNHTLKAIWEANS